MALLRRLLSFPLLFLVFLCIGTRLARSAPVPSLSLSTLEERDDLTFLPERFFDEQLAERNVHIEDLYERYIDSSDDLSERDDSEENTLVRRKSIFNKIKDAFKKVGKGIKNAAKKVGNGIKNAAKKVGNGIKKAAKKVGEGVKKAAKKVGEGVKKAAKKVGEGVKTAAKKVGKFVKENGAKVVKFGAKVISTAQSLAAKAAKFIPGVGKPISAALDGASKVTGLVADKVPAKLGKKLDKGFKVMDKIQDPVGGAAGAALNALRRDIDDDTDLFERDVDFDNIGRDFLDREELFEQRSYWDDEFDALL